MVATAPDKGARLAWTQLILKYVADGEEMQALGALAAMQTQGIAPGPRAFVAALRSCTRLAMNHGQYEALDVGVRIHHQLVSIGIDRNRFVVSTLIDMYAKCGRLLDARMVFDRMVDSTNVVAWNAMILGYANYGMEKQALDLLAGMKHKGCEPTTRTFVAALKACSGLAEKEFGRRMYEGGDLRLIKLHSLETGMAIHLYAQRSGLDRDIFVANALINMYTKCGSLVSPSQVFGRIPHPDVVSWTSMALAYADGGRNEELALDTLAQMQGEGCEPNALTLVAGVKACSRLQAREPWKEIQGRVFKPVALERGMALHSEALKRNLVSDKYVVSSLVDLYGKCGSLADAHRAFIKSSRYHPVSRTSLMLAYVENREARTGLELFHGAASSDAHGFVAALTASKALAEIETGIKLHGKTVKIEALETCMAIHSEAAKTGADTSTYVTSCLIDVYASCGSLVDAVGTFNRRKFQDVFSWTALILGYAKNGEGELGLQAFQVMQRSSSWSPNAKCYAAALAACAAVRNPPSSLRQAAREIECKILRRGLEVDDSLSSFICFS